MQHNTHTNQKLCDRLKWHYRACTLYSASMNKESIALNANWIWIEIDKRREIVWACEQNCFPLLYYSQASWNRLIAFYWNNNNKRACSLFMRGLFCYRASTKEKIAKTMAIKFYELQQNIRIETISQHFGCVFPSTFHKRKMTRIKV